MHADVLLNGGFRFFDASEHAGSNPLVSEFYEPTLHQIDP